VEAVLARTFKHPKGTISALNSTIVSCGADATWSIELSAGAPAFASGRGHVDLRAASLDTVTDLTTASDVVRRTRR
jgi:hypothetical protein